MDQSPKSEVKLLSSSSLCLCLSLSLSLGVEDGREPLEEAPLWGRGEEGAVRGGWVSAGRQDRWDHKGREKNLSAQSWGLLSVLNADPGPSSENGLMPVLL